MKNRLLFFLRRRGIIPYEPYTCRVCGHTVPLIGSRWEQAGLAVDHWEANHADPDYLPFECAHCAEQVKVGGDCGCKPIRNSSTERES